MSFLFLEAYVTLIRFDLDSALGSFASLYDKVRRCPTRPKTTPPEAAERICSAVDRASIWYWKEVLCLQRSAAAACLLRRHGVEAHMIIGAQQLPFKAHAWVEVDGHVVNDVSYIREMYSVLDRC
jgi:Transglutaminase-like superfamily